MGTKSNNDCEQILSDRWNNGWQAPQRQCMWYVRRSFPAGSKVDARHTLVAGGSFPVDISVGGSSSPADTCSRHMVVAGSSTLEDGTARRWQLQQQTTWMASFSTATCTADTTSSAATNTAMAALPWWLARWPQLQQARWRYPVIVGSANSEQIAVDLQVFLDLC